MRNAPLTFLNMLTTACPLGTLLNMLLTACHLVFKFLFIFFVLNMLMTACPLGTLLNMLLTACPLFSKTPGGSPPVGEGVMESCVNAFVQPAVNKSCLLTGLTVKRRYPSFI